MGNPFAQRELEAAGFPAATRELVYAVPVEELAGDSAELDLDVTVHGASTVLAVGYLPDGPVLSGQQRVKDGETRRLRKQLVKPGSMLVVALGEPAHVEVRVAGARGFDTEDPETNEQGFDTDDPETNELELDVPGGYVNAQPRGFDQEASAPLELDGPAGGVEQQLHECVADEGEQPLEADAAEISAIGAAAAATADKVAVMNGVLAQLERMYTTAQKERSTSFLLATGASVDEQLVHERSNLDYLKGTGFAKVVAGEAPLSSGDNDAPAWLEVANSSGGTLARIAGQVESWNLSNLIAKTAPNVAKVVEETAKGGLSLVNGLVTLGVLYALWRVLG